MPALPPLLSIGNLPGAELITTGLEHARRGQVTPLACLISMALPRLHRVRLVAPGEIEPIAEPELVLYRLLGQAGGDPFGRYQSLLRRLVSFEHALDRRFAHRGPTELPQRATPLPQGEQNRSNPPQTTIAAQFGGTSHLSPLLRKACQLGLPDAQALHLVAVKRGCRHYAPPDHNPAEVTDPGRTRLSDAELAIALISAAQVYDPRHIRCAAQLLGSPGIAPTSLVRLALMERCAPILRQIAEAALRYDNGHAAYWREIVTHLPTTRRPPPGVLPHPSRYVSLSGVTRPRGPSSTSAVWLRPVLAP